jgi:hypothetical protein
VDTTVSPTPAFFVDGRKLPLPDNVWFVGTANHDETTVDFAPKTYDRAHVLELPRAYDKFQVKSQSVQRRPVSLEALHSAFENAKRDYVQDAEHGLEFLNGLRDLFAICFGIGWGNRLEQQMRDYVPVVRACGGTVGEAIDYILAFKLLGKLRERQDIRPDDLSELRNRLADKWPSIDSTIRPRKSESAIESEFRRLGGKDE